MRLEASYLMFSTCRKPCSLASFYEGRAFKHRIAHLPSYLVHSILTHYLPLILLSLWTNLTVSNKERLGSKGGANKGGQEQLATLVLNDLECLI